MLELYLFVNPLGATCYQAEQNILRLAEMSKKRIKFKFVPLLNMESTTAIMSANNLNICNLQKRNEITQLLYRAVLDYKAAMFQGTKRGKCFLLHIQKQIHDYQRDYDEALVIEAAKASKLDLEMFLGDRHSDLAVKCFKKDQELAAKLNVHSNPTMIIYNLDGYDCGFAVKDCQSFALLEDLLLGDRDEFICPDFHRATSSRKICAKLYPLFNKQEK
ncbi:Thioredoxin [Ligilactobacillus sp. WC1T17]|uniref:Thioredoxin n=1 Tax=Ligilactobacillus ruminis TaxID=1623 RepID=A0ABY1A9Y3_9LACO|nr:Thioredoxin [Ligilactobacillus ruminis]